MAIKRIQPRGIAQKTNKKLNTFNRLDLNYLEVTVTSTECRNKSNYEEEHSEVEEEELNALANGIGFT